MLIEICPLQQLYVCTENMFPYSQVSLHLSYNQEFLCGGTIVDHNYVVTVAHCMYYNWGGILPPIILIVYAGRKSLYENVSTQYEVEAITFHELYKSSTLDYNIALIQVRQCAIS